MEECPCEHPVPLSALDEFIETDYANEQIHINTTIQEFSQSWK
jgi:hypothetical protein